LIKEVLTKTTAAAEFVKTNLGIAGVAIVIDASLSACLGQKFKLEKELYYSQIPHMTLDGRLLYGKFNGVPAYIMVGIGFCNEGRAMHEITFGVRIFQIIGVQKMLFVSPMCSVDSDIKVGDLALVRDHVALAGRSSIFGHNVDKFGTRFPDVSEAYNRTLQQKLVEAAKNLSIPSHSIIFSHFIGPVFDSFADAAYANYIGTQAICTSIAPEVVAARHGRVNVAAIGVITSSITKSGIQHAGISNSMATHVESVCDKFAQ